MNPASEARSGPVPPRRRSLLKLALSIYAAVIMGIIYLPTVVMVVLSFKTGNKIGFPIEGFTDFWYVGEHVSTALGIGGFLTDATIREAMWNSVLVGLTVTGLTTTLVLSVSLALRHSFRGRDLIFYLSLLGMFIPGSMYGFGVFLLYNLMDVRLGLLTMVPLQVLFALPFGLLITLARFDPDLTVYEQAARVLGASGWTVVRKVTIPLISPQILATILFSFTLSWGELLRSVFVVAGRGTLPTFLFQLFNRAAASPKHLALGTVVTAISIVLLVIAGLLLTRKGGKIL